MESGHLPPLTLEDRRELLTIARAAVEYASVGRRTSTELDVAVLSEGLAYRRGAFVTLQLGNELRGCIGHTACNLPLAEAVRRSARSSAKSDPRFNGIHPSELDGLRIEISALGIGDREDTTFAAVTNLEEIEIERDGLMVEESDRARGLLLPQVASERGWTVEEFCAMTCQKAGLPQDAWKRDEVRLYRFVAEVFEV